MSLTPFRSLPRWTWVALALAFATADLAGHLFHGWVPHDEGALALAAEMVRGGAWPHRDFLDIYSGGLALLDAGAQWALGDDLRSLRIPFGVAAIAWVGILYACLRRFTEAPIAAGLALVAFLWGPPLYTAALPTWYLLFLATAVLWAYFRWRETGADRWWGWIGLLLGVALFIKVNALFLIAGIGSALLSDRPPPLAGRPRDRRAALAGGVIACAGAIAATAVLLQGWPWPHALGIALPLLTLGVVALQRAADRSGEGGLRLAPLYWLGAGLGAVLIPWLAVYWAGGALAPLLEGILVLPFRRTVFARFLPVLPGLGAALAALGLIALCWRRWTGPAAGRLAAGAAFVMAALIVAGLGVWPAGVPLVWGTLRAAAPGALLVGALMWARRDETLPGPALPVLWLTAWAAMLQYPFGAPIYFAYVAPLFLLAAVAVFGARIRRPIALVVVAGLGLWTLLVDHGQPLRSLSFYRMRLPAEVPLELPRGGLQLPVREAVQYETVVALLDEWGAARIVAGPDAPEVYYLGGRPSPDRELFEFLAPDWSAETFAARIVRHAPDAVVLKYRADFSAVPLDSVVARLPQRPFADTTIGRFRLLRLRGPDAPP